MAEDVGIDVDELAAAGELAVVFRGADTEECGVTHGVAIDGPVLIGVVGADPDPECPRFGDSAFDGHRVRVLAIAADDVPEELTQRRVALEHELGGDLTIGPGTLVRDAGAPAIDVPAAEIETERFSSPGTAIGDGDIALQLSVDINAAMALDDTETAERLLSRTVDLDAVRSAMDDGVVLVAAVDLPAECDVDAWPVHATDDGDVIVEPEWSGGCDGERSDVIEVVLALDHDPPATWGAQLVTPDGTSSTMRAADRGALAAHRCVRNDGDVLVACDD